jgi:hypothetical protein
MTAVAATIVISAEKPLTDSRNVKTNATTIGGGRMKAAEAPLEGMNREAAEVHLEETNREVAEVAETDSEEVAEMGREVVAETDNEAPAETDREEAVVEVKVIAKQEAGLTTTEAEVEDAKWLVVEINVTVGPEIDADVTTLQKNPTLYKLVVGVVEATAVAGVDTLTATSACEWTSQTKATMNRTATKTIRTDMAVVTTKAMIKATIRATILLLVAGAVHPVEGAVAEDAEREAVVRATLIPEKVLGNKTPRVNLRKDNNKHQKEDRRTELVRTLPKQLPIILLLWSQRIMVVAAIAAIVVAAVEEEAEVASTRVEPTLGALLLPSRGSERRMARVMEIPTAVVEQEEEETLKNKSCFSIKKERWTNPGLGCTTCYLEQKKKVHQ